MTPLLDYVLFALEAVAYMIFFDTFFVVRRRGIKWLIFLSFLVECIVGITVICGLFPGYDFVTKPLTVIAILTANTVVFYRAAFIPTLFFSAVCYILLFFEEGVFVSFIGLEETLSNSILVVVIKVLLIGLFLLVRKLLPHIRHYLSEGRVAWTRFAWLPVFSGFIAIYFYYNYLSELRQSIFFSFVSVGMICLNIISLMLLQDSLLKDDRLKQSEMQVQRKQEQIKLFHDMQALYEQQGKKLHDYKKQLVTVQRLIENGDIEVASDLTSELTQSIAVEMSEINAGHPVVNAVLNQEYRIAKGKGIGMMFSISDFSNIKLSDEAIVVVFGNLLENAIHECEKIIKLRKDAIIQVKLANMDSEMVITVQNPVVERVDIEDNKIKNRQPDSTGIGLANIRETVEKYDGSFAISCDANEFTAVVII